MVVVVVIGEGEFGDVERKRRGGAIGEARAFVVVGFGFGVRVVGPILLEFEGLPCSELQEA